MKRDFFSNALRRFPRSSGAGTLVLAVVLVVLFSSVAYLISRSDGTPRAMGATGADGTKVLAGEASGAGSAGEDSALAQIVPSTTTTLAAELTPPPAISPGATSTTAAAATSSTTTSTTTTTSSTTTTTVATDPTVAAATGGPDPALAGSFESNVPAWVAFPGDEWQTASPRNAGLDQAAFNAWRNQQSPRVETLSGLHQQYPNQWGVALTRGGYLIYTAGNPDTVFQSASVGKTFTRLALLIADRKGLIDSVDDPVRKYWVGDGGPDGKLSANRKHMDAGYNADVTFRDLAFHRGGHPVTNGAEYAGDAFADNYAVTAPGTYLYSSGGLWRLSQALTYIFDDELKDVLDRELFQYIGIEPGDWDWIAGRTVFEDRNFWPVFNKSATKYYGRFVDPPYAIQGHDVQGGGGWVEMSPKDLARVALLIATDGYWDGRQLISPVDTTGSRGVGTLRYLGNHSGYAGSRMEGFKKNYVAAGWVRTQGFTRPNWDSIIEGPPRL